LIIDILKKLEGKGRRPKVHPALLKGGGDISDKKRSRSLPNLSKNKR